MKVLSRLGSPPASRAVPPRAYTDSRIGTCPGKQSPLIKSLLSWSRDPHLYFHTFSPFIVYIGTGTNTAGEGSFTMQMPTVESRVASLEAVQAQINERLGSIESRLTNMDNRLTSMEQGQRELANRMDNRMANMDNRLTSLDNRHNSNFKWLVGLLVIVLLANVGTAISVIITLTRQ